MKFIYLIFSIFFLSFPLLASDSAPSPQSHYAYHTREHTRLETLGYVSTLYALNWAGYYLSQPEEFKNNGSFKDYRKRFGKIVFDMDSSNWNQVVHPFVGSQVFLFYRSQSYSRMASFWLTVVQSTLFEFTIETYTEPASAQDLYQTPVLGSILGIFLEEGSLKLLNSSNSWARGLGHLMNPMTLFPFFEGKTHLQPLTANNRIVGLNFQVELP